MSDKGADKPLRIDVISDVMCPWCYIGKRRLENALASYAGRRPVEVHWQPFQLDATLPAEGKDRQLYLTEKFGGAANATDFYARIKREGDNEGLPFNFEAIAVSPNTRDAHRLISWAGDISTDAQAAVVEALFEAYFVSGENIGKADVLLDVWNRAGLPDIGLAEMLAGDERKDYVDEMVKAAHGAGVSGVPCFIFDRAFAVSGAQPAETLKTALDRLSNAA